MLDFGVKLAKYVPFKLVESLVVLLSKLFYGDLSKYGISRPKEGPFTLNIAGGKYPLLDVGTCEKIKSGEIQVTMKASDTVYS